MMNRIRGVFKYMEISLKDCALAVVKHLLPILLVSVFVFVALFAYFSANIETSYSYEVTFSNTTIEQVAPEQITSGSYAMHTYLVTVIPTQIDLLDDNSFYALVAQDAAVKALGKGYTAKQLQSMIVFSQPDDEVANFRARIVTATDGDSKVIADAISRYVPQYLKQWGHGNGNTAGIPEGPGKSTTNPTAHGIKGFLIAFVVLVAFFVLREAMDTRIKSEKVITTRFELPVLGSVPSFSIDMKEKGSDVA